MHTEEELLSRIAVEQKLAELSQQQGRQLVVRTKEIDYSTMRALTLRLRELGWNEVYRSGDERHFRAA